MVLSEFQQILKNQGVRLIPKQLPPNYAPAFAPEDFPRAETYVVDAQTGELAAAALLRNLLDRQPEARLLVMAEAFSKERSYAFLRGGAKGLLTYSEARDHLSKALSQVNAGGFWVPRTVLAGFVDHILTAAANGRLKAEAASDLSVRQQQVLDALLKNLSNKEIAARLNISERTVKFHVSQLLEKFGVRRRADLIVLCYQRKTPTA